MPENGMGQIISVWRGNLFFGLCLGHPFFFQVFKKETEGLVGGNGKIDVAAEVLGEFQSAHIVLGTIANPDGTHGNVSSAPCGTGYASGRDGIFAVQGIAGAQHHLACHLFAYGGLFLEYLMGHMEQILFHFIGIADDATFEIL